MITSTKYRANLYEDLFDKASKRLSNFFEIDVNGDEKPLIPGLTAEAKNIESIEEYFANLRYLVYGADETISSNDLQDRFIYLKLPLDEPPVWIDANTRLISKKIEEDGYGMWQNGSYIELKEGSNHPFFTNGIAVQGDEVAEIIYFEIDRFFDATDLSLMDIAVQWVHEDSLKGNSSPIYNYTPIIIKDIESKPGKLVFGWPINSEITNTPGKINFSIRFYEIDGTKIVYSFTTQPSTFIINSTILADVDTELGAVDNSVSLILGRLQNSIFGGYGDPDVPVFTFMSPNENNVIDDINEFDSDLYVLYQVAKGQIGYQWGYSDEKGNFTSISGDFSTLGISDQNNDQVGFLEVQNFISNLHRYYKFNELTEKYETVNIDSEKEFVENSHDLNGIKQPIYIRCAVLRLSDADLKNKLHSGNLEVNVQNKYYDKKTLVSDRKYWVIASPEEIDIDNDFQNSLDPTYILTDELKNIELNIKNTEALNSKYTICNWEGEGINSEDTERNIINDKITCPVVNEGVYTLTLKNRKNNSDSEIKEKQTFIYEPLPEIIDLESRDIIAEEKDGNVIISFNGNLPDNHIEKEMDINVSKIEGFPSDIEIEIKENQVIVKDVTLGENNSGYKMFVEYKITLNKINPINKEKIASVFNTVEKTIHIN